MYEFELDEIVYHVEYEYEKGEKETRIDPGTSACINVKHIYTSLMDRNKNITMVDILPLYQQLDGGDLDDLEYQILEDKYNK